MAEGSKSGCGGSVLFSLVVVVTVISAIPKEIWIMIGIGVGMALLAWVAHGIAKAVEKNKLETAERQRRQRAAEAAEARRQRIALLGDKNAARVDSAQSAARQLAGTEAARVGWLGDVDFSADIAAITENFRKAHALRSVIDELSALDNPSAEDRRILAEATAAAEALESAATERVKLIRKCASEAHGIDESLRQERADARTAEQRAELHGRLSGLLYGIESTPAIPELDSGTDRVMARVAAFREIKAQIQAARDDG